ncbi:hypothetical protein [Staphylococcus epidermidis]|uniref:hypothetical protein n=1 Tax=Staphylococcus epidermidis TaxID=1282 RepID=UPI001FB91DFA|nr:hypothetical protein [Staphylococcus epidermidis]
MTGPIGKEVHVDSLQELVKNVMKENAIGLLDNDFKEKLDNDLKNTLKKIRTHLKENKVNKVLKVFKEKRERPDHKVLKGNHSVMKILLQNSYLT